MKKQWIGFMIAGMLVAAVPTNVNAEDCYHNWSYCNLTEYLTKRTF